MDKKQTGFLKSQKNKPMLLFRYIDGIFLIWTDGEQELQQFLEENLSEWEA